LWRTAPERVRPIVETALQEGNHGDWPLITLNLDFKSEQPEHLRAVWSLREIYRAWLTTAPRTEDGRVSGPLEVRPVLVLTGESDPQERVFYRHVPVGGSFGAVRSNTEAPLSPPEVPEPEAATNSRRWWNNPWNMVEPGGQMQASEWTPQDHERLRTLVRYAHSRGLWIRFYTLDGATKQELSCHGWFRSYNFASLEAVKER
jgi:hypothetical protein